MILSLVSVYIFGWWVWWVGVAEVVVEVKKTAKWGWRNTWVTLFYFFESFSSEGFDQMKNKMVLFDVYADVTKSWVMWVYKKDELFLYECGDVGFSCDWHCALVYYGEMVVGFSVDMMEKQWRFTCDL
jgi:hypothetical protein